MKTNHMKPTTHNPNCDGEHCARDTGEVRVLPTDSEGNAILCRGCFDYEMAFRRERNHELEGANKFDLPTWDSLKVYGEAVPKLTLSQANDLIERADRLFHRAAKAWERGNNSGDSETLDRCNKQCDAIRERAEELLKPLGIVVDYPGLYPSFSIKGKAGNYHTTESAVSAALEQSTK